MTDLKGGLVVIPARGGSKRLPRKNVLPIAGKPLICWAIEGALEAGLSARIMVTSDDNETLSIASQYSNKGVIAHKRPSALATDYATTVDVLKEALVAAKRDGYQVDTLILLQPTSPLRTATDIINAIEIYGENTIGNTVVSVCEVSHPTAWVGKIDEKGHFDGVDRSGKRSQDYQKEYRLNGAIYVLAAKTLEETGDIFTNKIRACIMPRERSVDIDDEADFSLCERLLLK